MPRSAQRFLVLPILCILAVPFPDLAETQTLTAEGTYTMGEGETMTFAESMALQKAKQMALEQAGTYVESYTKVQNYQLTADEIQTIAGGVLQVEVLDKTRTLVGDGLKFFVKINATVTTDKVAELAQRIKGKNVAEEYQKLQEEYVRLNQEIEKWKQLVAQTPSSPERQAALEQIREREKVFTSIQSNEAAFFQRIVSGEAVVRGAQDKKAEVDRLIKIIIDHGHQMEVGEASAFPILEASDYLLLSVPVTLKISHTLLPALLHVSRLLGGNAEPSGRILLQSHIWDVGPGGGTGSLSMLGAKPLRDQPEAFLLNEVPPYNVLGHNYDVADGTWIHLSNDSTIDRYFQERIKNLMPTFELHYNNRELEICQLTDAKIRRIFPAVSARYTDIFEFSPIFLFDAFKKPPAPNTAVLLFAEAAFRIQLRLPAPKAKKLAKISLRFTEKEKEHDDHRCSVVDGTQ